MEIPIEALSAGIGFLPPPYRPRTGIHGHIRVCPRQDRRFHAADAAEPRGEEHGKDRQERDPSRFLIRLPPLQSKGCIHTYYIFIPHMVSIIIIVVYRSFMTQQKAPDFVLNLTYY